MKRITSSFANGSTPGLAGLSGYSPGERTLRLQNPYMRGADVAYVQNVVGVTDDGVFGPQTKAAVQQYQRRKGWSVADGSVGPSLWKVIRKDAGETPVSMTLDSLNRTISKYFDSVEAGKTGDIPGWLGLTDKQYDFINSNQDEKKSDNSFKKFVKYTAWGAVGVSILGVTLAALGDGK